MTPEQLKASILQYAVEGKLVKQNSSDEPASELLKKIENEKDQLIEEGKIKKSKKLPTIADDEKPFDIPDNWEWARLEDISTFMSGFAYKSRFYVKSASNQVIRLGNVKNDHLILDNKQVFIDDKYANETNAYKIREGNILFTMTGTRKKRDYFFTLLVNKKDVSKRNLYLNQRVGCLNHIFSVNKKWLNYILKSQTILDEVFINETGTANQGNIGSAKTMRIVLPIPPLEEQKRIVAKIEKLMPLVDEYAESYNRLQKIDNEFEDKLKQSVLQYAMEGKLVKQNSSDEPASELIKKIENEKAELVKEGKIKKSKKLPAITDDEKPFDIPDSWEWVRLDTVLDVRDGTHDTPKYVKNGIPLITSKNISNGHLDFSNIKYISEKDFTEINKRSNVEKGDIIFAMIGSIGNPVIVDTDRKFGIKNVALLKNINHSLDMNFVLHYLYLLENLWIKNASGAVQKFISLKKIRSSLIPFPPLEEQRRIVEKVEELQSSISNLSK
ncbi:restriction endonuclease subunit S [Lactobacillus kitasatonis]|uniref:Restriction endonuclease subunit S n=1 Tax=Lactobacillus kitasatonis TaxID=237446 RepID=A0ABS1LUS2_9LACO|nr:restriction endonuclease subunit S [Lactobacillus kitasatonis]MBL1072002.1 restriction endonuclease subunit S [Lactobacillus kitasatonis]